MTARDVAPLRTDGFMARSGPVEIILRILQSCDSTRDLFALVSTCRHVCSVWRGNVAAALWPVWLLEIPHFQDAIIAARMTQLVVDAERRGELPPTRFTPRELQQHRQHIQPTLSELRAAFGLHRLSLAIASRFCNCDLRNPQAGRLLPLDWGGPPEHPDRIPEWTARVSHAMFRLFIVGAALAGAYKEPLLRALEHPDPEIKALARRVPRDYSEGDGKGLKGLGERDMAFLLQFAVCDLEATLEARDAVFGPIAEWLLDSILSDKEARRAMADRFERGYGRARFCLSRKEDEDPDVEESWGPCPVSHLPDGCGSHSDAHLVVWELMQMFWLVEEVHPYGLQGSMLDRRAPRPSSTPNGGADEDNQRPLESAVAIFFGMFRAEETLLPTRADGPRPRLITHPAVADTNEEDHGDGKLPRSMSVAVFFDCLFHHSGRPNRVDDWTPVAPLDVKFFEYFLQRHLGLCLDSQAFREDEDEWMDRSFQEFNETLSIFAHDDVEDRGPYSDWSGGLERAGFSDGSEMLTKYPPNFARFFEDRGW